MVSKVEHLVLHVLVSNYLLFCSARSIGRNHVVTRVTLFTLLMLVILLSLSID